MVQTEKLQDCLHTYLEPKDGLNCKQIFRMLPRQSFSQYLYKKSSHKNHPACSSISSLAD